MKPILFFLFTVVSTTLFAQPKQNTYLLDKNGKEVFNKDSAETVHLVKEPDSGSNLYNVLDFYAKSGKKKFVGKSSKIDPVVLEGPGIAYYANGHMKTIFKYHNNHPVDTAYYYFPNGTAYTVKTFSGNVDDYVAASHQTEFIITSFDSTGKALVIDGNGHYVGYNANDFKKVFEEGELKNGKRIGKWTGHDKMVSFTEIYEDGKLLNGTATDSDGTYIYHQRDIPPQYKGGINEFYAYLAKTVFYPEKDRRNGTQGTVVLSFTITRTSNVKDIKLLRKVSPTIDDEAIRVLSKSKDWMPGVFYGRQSDCQFEIPISFALQ